MYKLKYNWAVMILSSKKYVTKVDNANRMSYWEDDKPAKLMSRKYARELACALSFNGNNAVVVEVPECWGDYLRNPPKSNDEVENNG